MPRKKKKPAVAAGRDTFIVLGPGGTVDCTKGAAPHALNVAQRLAEKHTEPATLYVERRSLFGPATQLYRVVRDEHGTVFTTTLNAVD